MATSDAVRHRAERAMEKRRSSVESDQREERVGAIFVGFYEDMADGVVLREQRRNLPDEQFKGCTAEQRPAETSDWLNQEQGIQAVFIGFRQRLVQLRHALRKGRQVSEIVPPNETHEANDPDQHARGTVRREKCDSEVGVLIEGPTLPGAGELNKNQKHRKPVHGNAD